MVYVPAMTCLCCGQWRIEVISLDGRATYKLMFGQRLASHDAYVRSTEAQARLLRRVRGPSLADFGADSSQFQR
jgi:hypothetical protein